MDGNEARPFFALVRHNGGFPIQRRIILVITQYRIQTFSGFNSPRTFLDAFAPSERWTRPVVIFIDEFDVLLDTKAKKGLASLLSILRFTRDSRKYVIIPLFLLDHSSMYIRVICVAPILCCVLDIEAVCCSVNI